MNKLKFYVYAYIRSKDSASGKAGTPYYIGKGCRYRAFEKHKNVPVPKNNLFLVFLETCLSDVGALALERRYIKWYGRIDNNSGILRNYTDGGEGVSGRICLPETRRKRSIAMSGEKHHNYGKLQTKEAKEKQIKTTTGVKKSEEHKASMRKPKSTTHAENISAGRKGIVFGEKQKIKIAKGASKYNFTFISPTGIVYEHYSMNQFCKEHNLCNQLGYDMMNKGVIPASKRKGITGVRKNISGWEILATPNK